MLDVLFNQEFRSGIPTFAAAFVGAPWQPFAGAEGLPVDRAKGSSVMDITPLPFRARLEEYQEQAAEVLEAWTASDPGAIQIIRQKHPRFLDPNIPWLPKSRSNNMGARLQCHPRTLY